jgi:hypothetical protein
MNFWPALLTWFFLQHASDAGYCLKQAMIFRFVGNVIPKSILSKPPFVPVAAYHSSRNRVKIICAASA